MTMEGLALLIEMTARFDTVSVAQSPSEQSLHDRSGHTSRTPSPTASKARGTMNLRERRLELSAPSPLEVSYTRACPPPSMITPDVTRAVSAARKRILDAKMREAKSLERLRDDVDLVLAQRNRFETGAKAAVRLRNAMSHALHNKRTTEPKKRRGSSLYRVPSPAAVASTYEHQSAVSKAEEDMYI